MVGTFREDFASSGEWRDNPEGNTDSYSTVSGYFHTILSACKLTRARESVAQLSVRVFEPFSCSPSRGYKRGDVVSPSASLYSFDR